MCLVVSGLTLLFQARAHQTLEIRRPRWISRFGATEINTRLPRNVKLVFVSQGHVRPKYDRCS